MAGKSTQDIQDDISTASFIAPLLSNPISLTSFWKTPQITILHNLHNLLILITARGNDPFYILSKGAGAIFFLDLGSVIQFPRSLLAYHGCSLGFLIPPIDPFLCSQDVLNSSFLTLVLSDIKKWARTLNVWYICLHERLIFMVNVGKYTSPIEYLGWGIFRDAPLPSQ